MISVEQKYTAGIGGKKYSTNARSENEALKILIDRYRIDPRKLDYLTHEEIGATHPVEEVAFVQGKDFKTFSLVHVTPTEQVAAPVRCIRRKSTTRPWFQLPNLTVKRRSSV